LAGNFTTYSFSLERVLLKKDRYLAGPSAEPASAPASSPPIPPATPLQAPSQASSQAPLQAPARAPAPAAPLRTSSQFGDKLLQALRPAEAKPEG
jgi:hypothetical protein